MRLEPLWGIGAQLVEISACTLRERVKIREGRKELIRYGPMDRVKMLLLHRYYCCRYYCYRYYSKPGLHLTIVWGIEDYYGAWRQGI
jgi:hypothetical protein